MTGSVSQMRLSGRMSALLAVGAMTLYLATTLIGPAIGLDQWIIGGFGLIPFALAGWASYPARRGQITVGAALLGFAVFAANATGARLADIALMSPFMNISGIGLLVATGLLAVKARAATEGQRRAMSDLLESADERNALLEMQSVIAETASALVKREPSDAIDVALAALHASVGAESVYVAMCDLEGDGRPAWVTSFDGTGYDREGALRLAWDSDLKGRLESSTQISYRHADQTELIFPIVSSSSTLSGLVGIVTPHRVLSPTEESMLKTVAELVGAAWDSHRNRERLQELLRSKDRFIASVSHELRTPLAVIVGLSAELRDRPFDEADRAELIGLISQQSEELGDMIEDLLVSARVEEQQLSVVISEVDLADLVPRILDSLPREVAPKVTCCDTRPPIVLADPLRLRQVIRNLIVNAHRHGGPNIRLSVGVSAGEGTVRVSDDGFGVPEEFREVIFSPYGRASFDPGRTDSIGLGLTVSRHLARLMGGDITYVGGGPGSTFEVTLPLADRQPEDVGLPMDRSCVVRKTRT